MTISHKTNGGIEEEYPWHVLLKFGDCELLSFSAAALFRNRNFRRDCSFFAGGLALVIEENGDLTNIAAHHTPLYATNHHQGYNS